MIVFIKNEKQRTPWGALLFVSASKSVLRQRWIDLIGPGEDATG
jgi:hypothetical protein